MIVTICGAYRNAGDHLIGMRARALLREYVDQDIITIDRKSVTDETYATFNQARAVMLCGGPAYQREIYPKVYPIERERITVPLIPIGLGFKAGVNKPASKFKFAPEAQSFVTGLHEKIDYSSARDPLTVEALNANGVKNVAMTGCPAWYALGRLDMPYRFEADPKSITLSMPAIMQPGVWELLEWLTIRFPKARRTVSFHHGVLPNTTPAGRKTGMQFAKFAAKAMAKGWKVMGLANSLPRMQTLYDATDLHIGYRVHAHLYCLSRRTPSILINEDIRGVGQAKALHAPVLNINGGDIEPITAAIDAHFDTRGAGVSRSVETMRETFPEMRRFLATI